MGLRISKLSWLNLSIFLLPFLWSNCYASLFIETSAGYAGLLKTNGDMQVSEGVGGHKNKLSMDSSKTTGVYHLGFGYHKDFDKNGFSIHGKQITLLRAIEVALDGYYSSGRNASGTVYEYEDMTMNNYKFNMTANTTRLMVTNRLIFSMPDKLQKLAPYFTWGLGVSSNYMKKYQEIANDDFGIPETTYGSLQTRHFAWQIGAGLSYNLLKSLDLYSEYNYVRAGDIESGVSNDQGIPNPVTGAKFPLHSSEIMFGIKYYLY